MLLIAVGQILDNSLNHRAHLLDLKLGQLLGILNLIDPHLVLLQLLLGLLIIGDWGCPGHATHTWQRLLPHESGVVQAWVIEGCIVHWVVHSKAHVVWLILNWLLRLIEHVGLIDRHCAVELVACHGRVELHWLSKLGTSHVLWLLVHHVVLSELVWLLSKHLLLHWLLLHHWLLHSLWIKLLIILHHRILGGKMTVSRSIECGLPHQRWHRFCKVLCNGGQVHRDQEPGSISKVSLVKAVVSLVV